jgi:hypothetical protein
MATLRERMQAAWVSGDPLALHREIERLAAEGHSQHALEDALEALLLAVRQAGAGADAEESVYGVWDRLSGWCHPAWGIEPRAEAENGTGANSTSDGADVPERKTEGKSGRRAP